MKKLLQILTSLLVLFLVTAFIGCKDPNTSNNDDTPPNIFAGTYTGSIYTTSYGGQTKYITVVATSSSYTIDEWGNENKLGNPDTTSTGTYTVSENTISGSGEYHTMTGTTSDNGATWSLTIETTDPVTLTGTITKQ